VHETPPSGAQVRIHIGTAVKDALNEDGVTSCDIPTDTLYDM